jgi:hypothetical protein
MQFYFIFLAETETKTQQSPRNKNYLCEAYFN